MKNKKITLILFYIIINIRCQAIDYGISLYPVFRHYDMQTVCVDADAASIPWGNGFRIESQLYHINKKKYRFYSALAYNSGKLDIFITSAIDNRDYILSAGKMHFIEYSFNYSYDIQLTQKWYLNPETGIAIQLPFIQANNSTEYSGGTTENYKHVPSPTIGANLNLWFKYPLKNKQTIKVGVCSYLPFYRTQLGTYTVANRTETIESGLGYIGFGLSYIFKNNK